MCNVKQETQRVMTSMNEELNGIIKKALHNGLPITEICHAACIPHQLKFRYKRKPINFMRFSFITSLIIVFIALKNPELYVNPKKYFSDLKNDWFSLNDTCLLHHSGITVELTRRVSTCSLCKGLEEVPTVPNMTQEYFIKHHAYTAVPVLIKGAVSHWSAMKEFSFEYFRNLYDTLDAYEENSELGCQFFPYKTHFYDLEEVFHMKKEKAKLLKDQWYIGWSNCVPRIMKSLRKHYNIPEFLPDDSESSHLDWMFMGGSGTGANMHIDAVNRPSWQAMIRGRKTWYLEPPPECESVCKRHLNVTMEPGDILVVDTNQWYHSTYIHPGNMSITIGSEYD